MGWKYISYARSDAILVIEKTGSTPTGTMTLDAAIPAPGIEAAELLRRAGAVEAASEHPIARAIADGAREQHGTLPEVTGFTNLGAGAGLFGGPVGIGRAQGRTPDTW